MNNKIFAYNNRFNTLSNITFKQGKREIRRVDVPDKYKQLLDLIYKVDPVTGLPSGDIGIYLSDSANAEVKDFVRQQLMRPSIDDGQGLSMSTSTINQLRQTITDDDIAQFSRDDNETVEDYAERISQSLNRMRFDAYKKRQLKQTADYLRGR